MKRKKLAAALSVLCAVAILAVQIITVIPVSAGNNISNVFTDTLDYGSYEDRIFWNKQGESTITENTVDGDTEYLMDLGSWNGFAFFPMDTNGNRYTFSLEKGATAKYIVKFDYKYENGGTKALEFSVGAYNPLTSKGTGWSTVAITNTHEIAKDKKWHTITFIYTFTNNTSETEFVLGVDNTATGWNVYRLDDFNIIPIEDYQGVTYLNTNGGNEKYDPIVSTVGDAYQMPIPTKEGMEFDGWYADELLTIPYDGKFPADGTTLYAKWKGGKEDIYTKVMSDTFEYNADRIYGANSSVTTTQIVDGAGADGSKALKVSNTGKTAFTLVPKNQVNAPHSASMSSGETLTYILKFDYKLESGHQWDDLWLKAVAAKNENLASNYKQPIAAIIGQGNALDKFGDWDTIPGLGNDQWRTAILPVIFTANASWDMSIGIFCDSNSADVYYLDNIEIYKVNSEHTTGTVFFKTNGGTPLDSVSWVVGEDYVMPTPERDGYVFDGWYTDEAFTTAYNGKFPANGADNCTNLYAKWNLLESITKVVTDNFEHDAVREYKAASDIVTVTTENGKGIDCSRGAEVEFTNKGSFNLMPKNVGGNTYTFDVQSGQKYKFIINFKYKFNSGFPYAALWIKSLLANADTGAHVAQEIGCIVGPGLNNSVLGSYGFINANADTQWHTASIAAQFSPTSNASNVAVGLFFDSTQPGSISIDDIEIYRVATEKNVTTVLFDAGSVKVDPISWVSGEEFSLPKVEKEKLVLAGWYSDSNYTKPYISTTFPDDVTTLYGEVLTENGFYAEEHFDNNEIIWENQMKPNAHVWENYGIKGKMRNFTLSDKVFHDSDGSGRSLKYERDGLNGSETYGNILLTNNVDDQIYVGSKEDETPSTYIVSFYVKCEKAESDIGMSVSGGSPLSEWEGNTMSSDAFTIPVLSTCDWTKVSLLYTAEWQDGMSGSFQTTSWLKFSINGTGTVYIDDFEVTKVKSGKGQTIHFDTDGGTLIAPIAGEESNTIKMPEDPVKKDYIFGGWFYDLGYETPFNSTSFNDSGTTYLFAKWDEDPNAKKEDKWGDMEEFDDGTLSDEDITVKEPEYDYEYIYEDVYEEYEVPYNRKKIVLKTITQKPTNSGTGISILWIILIIAAVVLISAAVATVIIVKKRRRHTRSQ